MNYFLAVIAILLLIITIQISKFLTQFKDFQKEIRIIVSERISDKMKEVEKNINNLYRVVKEIGKD